MPLINFEIYLMFSKILTLKSMTNREATGTSSSVLLVPNRVKHIEIIELRRMFNRQK